MQYRTTNLSQQINQLNKGLAEFVGLLDGANSDTGSGNTYTDSEGNTVKLSVETIDDSEEYGTLTIEIHQKNSSIVINVVEPSEQLLGEIKKGTLLNGDIKTK